ncbi:MAG: spore coat associated protein CotJA [Eubacterium sp.]
MNTMHNGTGCGMNRSFNAGNRQMPPSHRDSDNSTHECGCKRNEGCDRGNEPVDSMVPAMSYVPWQIWRNIYCIEEGLEKGTIFEDMDKPYIGRCGKK